MCVNGNRLPSNPNGSLAPCGLPFFILDEIGEQTNVHYVLCAQLHVGAENTRNLVVLGDDLGDDG